MTPQATLRLLCLLPLAACASTQSVPRSPFDAGPALAAADSLEAEPARIYTDSLEAVARAASVAVLAAGLRIDTTFRPDSQTVLLIARSGSPFAYREMVRVEMSQLPSGESMVRVHTEPRVVTDYTYTRWSGRILTEVGTALAREHRSRPGGGTRASWAPVLDAALGIEPGARVRVALGDGRRVSGSFSSVTDSALRLKGRREALPAAAIDSLWVRESHKLTGAAAGAGVGTAVGIAMASNVKCRPDRDWSELFCQGEMVEWLFIVLGSAAVGAGAGAVIGHLIPHWSLRFP